MTCFDTDALTCYLKASPKAVNKVNELADVGEFVHITSITMYEILKGLRHKGNIQTERKFIAFLEKVEVIPLCDRAVVEAAEIYAQLRKKGVTIGDADIFIAAIVKVNNGWLVTNNTKHYQNIEGLWLETW